jgi:hypothetical protein
MKNPASIPLQGTQAQGPQAQGPQAQGPQGPQGLQIQIPTEKDVQEYNREKEERRQQALERLRNENMALPRTPSVPRPTGWESLGPKKN